MMKYSDLIDSKTLKFDEVFYNQESQFTIQRSFFDTSYFISFIPKQWSREQLKAIKTHWKIHLSIHPEDLAKAWRIIYPLLYQQGAPFKIANYNILTKFIKEQQSCLQELLKLQEQFQSNLKEYNKYAFHVLLGKLYQIEAQPHYSPWKLLSFLQRSYTTLSSFFTCLFLNKDKLIVRVQNKFERLITKENFKITSSLRFYNGMQFTLYTLPGLESGVQELLKKIESRLIKANVRPGIIYPTDKRLGLYSSIRHPGKKIYYNAIHVGTYNPNNAEDPFIAFNLSTDLHSLTDKITTATRNSSSEKINHGLQRTFNRISTIPKSPSFSFPAQFVSLGARIHKLPQAIALSIFRKKLPIANPEKDPPKIENSKP